MKEPSKWGHERDRQTGRERIGKKRGKRREL